MLNSKKYYAGWRAYWHGEIREETQSMEWLGGFDAAMTLGENECKKAWKGFQREYAPTQDRPLNYESDGNILFA